jgi:low affinity Fe/Cu permease
VDAVRYTSRYRELRIENSKYRRSRVHGHFSAVDAKCYLVGIGKKNRQKKTDIKLHFSRFAHTVSFRLASAWAYVVGGALIFAWIISGPYFNYSPQWQFAMTAGTSIATFLLVLILQHTDFRQTKTIQLKLDELLRAMERARNELVHLEAKPDEQIETLDEQFEQLQEDAPKPPSGSV